MVIDIAALPLRGDATRVFDGTEHDGVDVSFLVADVAPGEGPPLHAHPYEEIFVLHEGRARFTVGADTIEASQGQIVVAPAGIAHTFRNTGPGRLRSVNIHPRARMETTWLDDPA